MAEEIYPESKFNENNENLKLHRSGWVCYRFARIDLYEDVTNGGSRYSELRVTNFTVEQTKNQ